MSKKTKPQPFFITLANILRGIDLTGHKRVDHIKSAIQSAQNDHSQFKSKWIKLFNELDGQNQNKVLMECANLRDMVFELAEYDCDNTNPEVADEEWMQSPKEETNLSEAEAAFLFQKARKTRSPVWLSKLNKFLENLYPIVGLNDKDNENQDQQVAPGRYVRSTL